MTEREPMLSAESSGARPTASPAQPGGDARERDRRAIETVLLAAGAGRRFGGGKLLARFGKGAVLAASIRNALAAPVRRVTMMVGYDARAVSAEAERVAAALGAADRLRVVTAPDWAEGMAASLRAGIAALGPDVQAVFVALADMPAIPAPIWGALLEAATAEAAAAPTCGGRRGHPALIGRALFPELLALQGDQGARAVLDRLGDRLARVPTEDLGVLRDIDTPADLRALQAD